MHLEGPHDTIWVQGISLGIFYDEFDNAVEVYNKGDKEYQGY